MAALMRAGRFEELDRYDGHSPPGNESGYAAYLRAQGYNSDDPWSDYVIAADGPDGEKLSGWHMRNVGLPARVAEEHSETAYMTREAMRFVEDMGEKPWFLHLSYVKPHWPYMAPAPYHNDVRRQGLPAAQPRRSGAGRSAPRAGRLSPARGIGVLSAARGARHGAAGLHGPDQADRRLARPPVRSPEEARPLRRHADLLHRRPRRFPGRPLAGRKGDVLRGGAARALHRLRSRPVGRRHARHRRSPLRRGGRCRADLPRRARPASLRTPDRRPLAAAAAARRHDRDVARRGVLRARLFLPRGAAAAEAQARRTAAR